jgi:hypothetical protein
MRPSISAQLPQQLREGGRRMSLGTASATAPQQLRRRRPKDASWQLCTAPSS